MRDVVECYDWWLQCCPYCIVLYTVCYLCKLSFKFKVSPAMPGTFQLHVSVTQPSSLVQPDIVTDLFLYTVEEVWSFIYI